MVDLTSGTRGRSRSRLPETWSRAGRRGPTATGSRAAARTSARASPLWARSMGTGTPSTTSSKTPARSWTPSTWSGSVPASLTRSAAGSSRRSSATAAADTTRCTGPVTSCAPGGRASPNASLLDSSQPSPPGTSTSRSKSPTGALGSSARPTSHHASPTNARSPRKSSGPSTPAPSAGGVLGGAGFHRARSLKGVLVPGGQLEGLSLIYLPPYGPDQCTILFDAGHV